MKRVFILQNSSALSKRVLRRIGTERDQNTFGFEVEDYKWSFKLKRFKKPKIIKFEFFSMALDFTNYFNGL